MTTSVFYDTTQRGLDLARNTTGASAGETVADLYTNLTTLLTTGVTQVQSVNNSASTTNPTATFGTTPVNGNAMVAIIIRGSDNVSSTNGSWTLLTSQGSAGARRVEMWWRRAGASEPTAHTWTNATAALWECTLLEFGGWAAVADPQVILGGLNQTSAASATFNSVGILCGVCALATSGGSATFTGDTATNAESLTSVAVTTTLRFRQFVVDAYTNQPAQTISTAWTTSRPSTRAQVGWFTGDTTNYSVYGHMVGNDTNTANSFAGQLGLTFDTSAIPDVNTVSSATLTLGVGYNVAGYPANTPVNVYSLAGASTAASNANGPAVWKTPTEFGGLTRVATRAAGSTWVLGNAYTWTSDSTFPDEISKTGNTTLLIATGDQASGTTRGTQEVVNLASTVGSVHYLTVVHSYLATASMAATMTATPSVGRTVDAARTMAATLTAAPAVQTARTLVATLVATLTGTPTVERLLEAQRTLAVTVTMAPTVTGAAALFRSMAATLTGVAAIRAAVYPFSVQAPRILRLAGRSVLRLAQSTRAQLPGRSTLRLPKE